MTEQHSLSDARRDLSRLVREAESGNAVKITRHGEPVAVLIDHSEFERLTSARPGGELACPAHHS